jgi:maleylpyruvate isomerase
VGSDTSARYGSAVSQPEALEALAASTQRLAADAHSLDETALREPSRLPGWSRAHVLAHIAGNAGGLTNLATWATTGVETPQYASREAREREINEGAAGSHAEIIARLEATADRLAEALAAIPADRLDFEVSFLSGATVKAKRIVAARMREVEIHHVDLDVGYEPSDWPPDFVDDALHNVARTFDGKTGVPGMTLEGRDSGSVFTIHGGGPPTLAGPDWRLLAWLTGRQDGRYLVVSPAGPPPTLPAWS